MEPQDAAELILQGLVWESCPVCKGAKTLLVHDEVESCKTCKGSGEYFGADYLEACRVLGLPLPNEKDLADARVKAFEDLLKDAKWKKLTVDKDIVTEFKKEKPWLK